MGKNCSKSSKCIFGKVRSINRKEKMDEYNSIAGVMKKKYQRFKRKPALRKNAESHECCCNNDPPYDSAAEVKGEVKEITLC